MIRAEYVFDLVGGQVVYVLTGICQVLARIEVFRMLGHVLADTGGHSQADIGVDVDLANGHGSSLAELVFRNADSVSQVAAVGVDDLDVFRNDGGSTVEYDREARQAFGNFFENVEAQCRRYENALFIPCALGRREFVSAVARADGNCQGIDARTGNEFFYFFRTCIGCFVGSDLDFVFNAGELA